MSKKLTILFFSTVLLAFPSVTFAIFPLKTIIDNVMTMILWPLFVGIAVIMTFWSGYLFLAARNDPSKILIARKVAVVTIIGVVIALAAKGIIEVIENIFGL